MTTLREAAQRALEALCLPCSRWNGTQSKIVDDAITALRAALAEPEQSAATNIGCLGMPVNTPVTPPQRKPLTEVDLRALYDQHAAYQEEGPEASGWWEFARAIERAHGIGGDK